MDSVPTDIATQTLVVPPVDVAITDKTIHRARKDPRFEVIEVVRIRDLLRELLEVVLPIEVGRGELDGTLLVEPEKDKELVGGQDQGNNDHKLNWIFGEELDEEEDIEEEPFKGKLEQDKEGGEDQGQGSHAGIGCGKSVGNGELGNCCVGRVHTL